MILVAGNFAGSGWIVGYIFNIDYTWALIIISVIIFVYTVAGGLFSSAATTVIQIYPAVIGFAAAAIWLLQTYGWDHFAAALPDTLGAPENYYNLTGLTSIDNGAMINFAGIMALALGDVIALDFMERIFAGKSGKIARNACFLAAFLTLIVGSAATLMGLFAHALFANNGFIVEDTRMILPQLAMEFLPFGIGLLVMTGIIGAGASTASGGLVGVSTALGRNIYQKNLHRWWLKRQGITEVVHQTEEDRAKFDSRLLLISRVVTIPVVLAAVWLAHVKPEPGILLVLAFDIGFAACVPALFLGVYWKKANAAGAVASIIIGSFLRIVLYIAMPADSPWAGIDTFIPPLCGLIAMWFVSLATQKSYPPKPQAMHEIPSETDVLAGLA